MNTLIKFYDSEILYNIVSVHCMTPARCVYLYDPAQDDTEQLHHIRHSLTKRFPAMDITLRPISYHKPDTIVEALSLLYAKYPGYGLGLHRRQQPRRTCLCQPLLSFH